MFFFDIGLCFLEHIKQIGDKQYSVDGLRKFASMAFIYLHFAQEENGLLDQQDLDWVWIFGVYSKLPIECQSDKK